MIFLMVELAGFVGLGRSDVVFFSVKTIALKIMAVTLIRFLCYIILLSFTMVYQEVYNKVLNIIILNHFY